jgi:hypothetical protein
MNNFIDRGLLQKFPFIVGDSEQDTNLLISMMEQAKDFICSHPWGKEPDQSYLACGIGGLYSIWLFDYNLPFINEDKSLWVIVGDIPPAYLVTDEILNCKDALMCYISIMRDWIKCVKNNDSLVDCFPVDVEPNIVNANLLSSRLDFLDCFVSTS